MRSSAHLVADKVKLIRARPRIFCLPYEICSGPPIAVSFWMNPAATFVSAGAWLRRVGEPGSLPLAIGIPRVFPS